MIHAIEEAVKFIRDHSTPQSVHEVRYAETTGGPGEVNWSGMDMVLSHIPCQKIGTITCGELAQLLAREVQRMREVKELERKKWGLRLEALCEAKLAMQLINAKADDPHLRRIIGRMDDAILGIVRDNK